MTWFEAVIISLICKSARWLCRKACVFLRPLKKKKKMFSINRKLLPLKICYFLLFACKYKHTAVNYFFFLSLMLLLLLFAAHKYYIGASIDTIEGRFRYITGIIRILYYLLRLYNK